MSFTNEVNTLNITINCQFKVDIEDTYEAMKSLCPSYEDDIRQRGNGIEKTRMKVVISILIISSIMILLRINSSVYLLEHLLSSEGHPLVHG